MRIASSLFVAAVLVRGGHTHRILQDVPIAGLSSIETIESSSSSSVLSLESSSSSDLTTTDVPIVGLGSMETIESSSSSGLSSEPSSSSDSTTTGTMYTEEELVAALEVDERFTVIGLMEVGELLCDTLGDAEDAKFLSFTLLGNDTIVAEKTSYTATDGDVFDDGVGLKVRVDNGRACISCCVLLGVTVAFQSRDNGLHLYAHLKVFHDSVGLEVWTGTVTDPEQGPDEATPRTVAMVWGEVCDAETFLRTVTTQHTDGTTTIVKTVPCLGSTTHTCLAEVLVQPDLSTETMPEDDIISLSSTTSSLAQVSSSASLRGGGSRRTVIDVMVMFSTDALESLCFTPRQMRCQLMQTLALTNVAFMNSAIPLTFNAVHISPLPFEQTSTTYEGNIAELEGNEIVQSTRDLFGADLVQMIGEFDYDSGWGYYFTGSADRGFSVVRSTVLEFTTSTHEYGHNLGCRHDRENTNSDLEYAHGLRYCDGDDPYRTIMTYSTDCTSAIVINSFSNPDVSHLDKPTGTDTEDNARTIKENMVAVSNFKSRRATR